MAHLLQMLNKNDLYRMAHLLEDQGWILSIPLRTAWANGNLAEVAGHDGQDGGKPK